MDNERIIDAIQQDQHEIYAVYALGRTEIHPNSFATRCMCYTETMCYLETHNAYSRKDEYWDSEEGYAQLVAEEAAKERAAGETLTPEQVATIVAEERAYRVTAALLTPEEVANYDRTVQEYIARGACISCGAEARETGLKCGRCRRGSTRDGEVESK